MSAPTAYDCPLDVSAATLSAWRDGLLDARATAQLQAHVYDCAACQARLAAFDRLGATLRSGGADPNLREPVWAGLRARILRDGGRKWTHGRPAVWGGGIATVAAALLVVLFLALFAGHARHNGPTTGTPAVQATASPSATPAATATRQPTAPVGGAGWSNVFSTANLGGPILAFAPSDPQIAYICGVASAGATTLFASSDGGASYQPSGALPASGQCNPSVDPTDPRDVAVAIQTSSSSTNLYRSRDGGATWQPLPLGGFSVMTMGWQDGALWATAAVEDSGGPGLTELWVSRNGGAMTEVDQNGNVPNGVSLTNLNHAAFITGHDAIVYIVFGQTTAQPISETAIRSVDNGVTWAPVKFMDGSRLVDVVTTTPDAKTLVGIYDSQNSQVVISHDDGATWLKLPGAPSNVTAFDTIWATPDGSVLAVSSQYGMAQNPDNNLYALAAGAPSWSVPLAIPTSVYAVAVSWDAGGKPAAIWASGTLNAGSGVFKHALGG